MLTDGTGLTTFKLTPFEQWYNSRDKRQPTDKLEAQAGWDAGHDSQNQTIADLTAKLQEAERKLEPSPCQVEGHLRLHWMEGYSVTYTIKGNPGTLQIGPGHCTACAAIAKAKDEALVEAAKAQCSTCRQGNTVKITAETILHYDSEGKFLYCDSAPIHRLRRPL